MPALLKNLVVIPTYNEAANVAPLVAAIRRVDASDILIVDDNSPDGTGDVADRLAREDPTIGVIHRAGKLGIGSAHIEGIEYAWKNGYDTVLTMDCDFTHPPEYVPALRQALVERDADLVIGSRYLRRDGIADWSYPRRLITRTADFLTTVLLGLHYDATNALRIYRVASLDMQAIRANTAEGYSFFIEMLFLCRESGLRIAEIPVHLPLRQSGHSKISRVEIVRAVGALFRLSARRAMARRTAFEDTRRQR